MVSIPSIFLLSAAAVIVAIAGFWIVRRLVKPIDLNEHQSFLDAMLSIVGTLVLILLGLLVAAALDHYQALEQSVDCEAANLAQMYRLSFGVPQDTRKRIQQLCMDYGTEVVNDEWPQMEHGQASHKVLMTYVKLVGVISTFHPATNGETNIHSALLNAMQQIGDGRRQRLLALRSAWNAHLMPVLLMCSAIVLAFAYLYVRQGAILHGVLICFVAVALGANLGLVFLLSNPFSGDWKISPRGFELNLEVHREVESTPEFQKLLQQTGR